MKSSRYLVILAAFSLLSGGPAFADGAAVSSDAQDKAPGQTAYQALQAEIALQRDEALKQAAYQVLLAEIALRRNDVETAVQTYALLAVRTRDPRVMERAIGIAEFARQFDVALEIAHLWLDAEPASQRAQETLTDILIASNRFDELAPHLTRMLESNKTALPENLLGLNRKFARNPDRVAVFRLIEVVCRPFSEIAEAHYAVALAAVGAQLSERAKKEIGQALELNPEWEMAAMLQTQLLMPDARDEAIESMENFLKRNPDANRLRLLFARVLAGERRYVDAKREFDRLLQDTPNDPEIVHSIAMLALQFNDKALAKAQLEHLATLDSAPDRSAAYFFLGQIAEDDGHIDEALARYALVVSGEHYLAARARQARLLFGQDRFEEGRELLRNARTHRPEEALQMQITEAALLREAGRVREAFDFLEQRLAENPEQVDLMYETALLAERLNWPDLMRSRLRRLIELRPDNPQAYNALGYSYADRKVRLPEARKLIEKALSLAPDDAAILDSMGWVLFRLGNLPDALSYLERSYDRREDPEIAAHLGEVLWTIGRRDDARNIFSEAKKKFPANAVLSETVRRIEMRKPEEGFQMQITEAAPLRDASRVWEAFNTLKQRLAENPEQVDLMYETALLAEQLNRLDLMESCLRHLIELRPDNPQAYNALGYSYADRNVHLPEARQLIEKALSLAPDDAAILDSMGWVLFRLGNLPDALSYLERSYDRREDPEIAAHLGEVLWMIGRRDDAQHILSEAKKKFPTNAVLSETLRRMSER